MYFDQAAFGKRLKELRERKGLSQEAVAEVLHTSKTHYGNMERGKKGVSVDFLLEIAEVFRVSTDYLLTGKERGREREIEQLHSVIDTLSELVRHM